MMKTIFKSIVLAAVTLGFYTGASAQSLNTSEDMGVSAKILRKIELDAFVDLNFGIIEKGTATPVYLDPRAQANNAFIGTQAVLGHFTMVATGEEVIELVIPTEVTLTRIDPSNPPTFVPTPTADDRVNFVPNLTAQRAASEASAQGATPAAADLLLSTDFPVATTGEPVTVTGNNAGNGTCYVLPDNTGWIAMFVGGYLYQDGSTTLAIPTSQTEGNYAGTLTVTANYYSL